MSAVDLSTAVFQRRSLAFLEEGVLSLARMICRSGYCARTEGYETFEIRENFAADGRMICNGCRAAEVAMRVAARERQAALEQ